MLQFIILGVIPGTSIQITFFDVANIVGILVAIYLTYILLKEFRNTEYINYINGSTLDSSQPSIEEIAI